MSITLLIIICTVLISLVAFQNNEAFERLSFHPFSIIQRKEWQRMISVGFVHNDISHLLFNMLTLYFFGTNVEQYFIYLFENRPIIFIAFYFVALIVSGIPDLIMNRNNYNYRAVGASGAVSSIVFASILFDPRATIYLQMFIPIPALLYAAAYLFYSFYMARKGTDNIGHLTHFAGAIFGLIFPILLKPQILSHFIAKLTE
jgi:membrane associated rhomboid family serine protease